MIMESGERQLTAYKHIIYLIGEGILMLLTLKMWQKLKEFSCEAAANVKHKTLAVRLICCHVLVSSVSVATIITYLLFWYLFVEWTRYVLITM